MREATSAQRQLSPPSTSRRGTCTVITQDPRATSETPERPSTGLPLSPALRTRQARELREKLLRHMRRGQLELAITDNRAVMISVQRDPRHGRYAVRLHHLFVDAPEPVIAELARYILSNDRSASKLLGDFIETQNDRIRPRPGERPSPPTPRSTRGKVHDLSAIFAELNRQYFEERVCCEITWGRHACRGRERRSIKVGSYSLEENLIRIHPGLDQEWVPAYYLRWVVYHEMLHAVHPPPRVNGRHLFHTDAFSADERQFDAYLVATAWERRNLAALLCI